MSDVPFAEAVSAKVGIPLEMVEKVLGNAGVPTADEAAVPHRLRVNRLRFDGTKAGVHTDTFVFDRTFGPGLWAICTDKNDAGKTSVLEIIMWALRGEPHRPSLQPDVEQWIDSVLVEATLDEEPFTVSFQLIDGAPFGSLTVGDEVTPFSNEDAFTNVMSDFMVRRLGFFELTTWDGTQKSVAHHGWASCSAALYLSRAAEKVVLGDIATAGVPQRLLLMFVGVKWGQTYVACHTAMKQEEDRTKEATITSVRVRNATAGTIEARRAELELIRRQLDALPAALPEDTEIAAAQEAWMRAIADHGLAQSALALARSDAATSKRALTRQQKRLQDHSEAAIALALLHGLRPVACPRCSAAIGDDRRQAEVEAHTCSVCDRNISTDTSTLEGPVSDEDADEPLDEAAFAALVADLRQAADADVARVQGFEARVDRLESSRQEAAGIVARYGEQAGALSQRRDLEIRLATAEAVIEQLETLAAGTEPLPPVDGGAQLLAILKAATAEAKTRMDDGFAQVFTDANAAILELGHRFGFDNLQSARLDAGTKLKLMKGGKSVWFSDCSPGERLRLRIAIVVALLRVADKLGIGRHPGFLLIDSIGAEETEPGDLAAFVKELAAVTEELGVEIIVASARPEILTHVPAEHQIVATGNEFLW